jgi:hypothetical protein
VDDIGHGLGDKNSQAILTSGPAYFALNKPWAPEN